MCAAQCQRLAIQIPGTRWGFRKPQWTPPAPASPFPLLVKAAVFVRCDPSREAAVMLSHWAHPPRERLSARGGLRAGRGRAADGAGPSREPPARPASGCSRGRALHGLRLCSALSVLSFHGCHGAGGGGWRKLIFHNTCRSYQVSAIFLDLTVPGIATSRRLTSGVI